ncbi:MAG: hypothetical protein AAF517_20360, partial [Planctomycetota bacterium]
EIERRFPRKLGVAVASLITYRSALLYAFGALYAKERFLKAEHCGCWTPELSEFFDGSEPEAEVYLVLRLCSEQLLWKWLELCPRSSVPAEIRPMILLELSLHYGESVPRRMQAYARDRLQNGSSDERVAAALVLPTVTDEELLSVLRDSKVRRDYLVALVLNKDEQTRKLLPRLRGDQAARVEKALVPAE